ncbi:MAG: PP2C family protein-serine/threonine phosphatase [Planctomycetota bacterium]|jgi:sigma-B regulation protein RsbU (phosphoserine phosphatase)
MSKKTKRQIERDEQIYQLSTLVAGDFSLQEVLDRLAEAAVKIVGVKACSIRLLDEGAGDLKMRSTYGLSEEYRNKGVVSKDDPVVKAAFSGEAVVLDDMRIDSRVKYKEAAVKEGLVSQLTVAMNFKGKAIGVLRLYSPKPMHFDEDDISLARAVASQCAVAITNARLYARAIDGARMAEQMRLAGLVQRRMITEQIPTMPGLDIAATYIPCFDVGGDFYDFRQVGDTRIITTIADVMGKGIPAAIMMSWFRGAARAYAEGCLECGDCQGTDGYFAENTQDRAKLVNRTRAVIRNFNRMACDECRDGEFVTLFYAMIDVTAKTLTYCNCGHEPTVLIRGGQTTDLQKGGLVLGVNPEAEYEIETVELKDDDFLLFYTDGLTDAVNFDNELWGREKLLETARKYAQESAEQMVKDILGYRRRFVGLARQIDDTSMVVVKMVKR